jgi:hypothetical protein
MKQANSTKKQQSVFLSYAREDLKIAYKVYNDIRRADVTVWFDKEELLPGQKWKSTIYEAIKNSKYFIALLSNNSVSKRGFIQKELKTAFECLDEIPESDTFIIPVRLDDCNPKNNRLSDYHWADLFPSYENGLRQILRVIAPEYNTISANLNLDNPENNIHTRQDGSPFSIDLDYHIGRPFTIGPKEALIELKETIFLKLNNVFLDNNLENTSDSIKGASINLLRHKYVDNSILESLIKIENDIDLAISGKKLRGTEARILIIKASEAINKT